MYDKGDLKNNFTSVKSNDVHKPAQSQIDIDNTYVQLPFVEDLIIKEAPVFKGTNTHSSKTLLEILDLNQSQKEDGAKSVGRIETNQDHNATSSKKKAEKDEEKYSSLLARLKETRLWLLSQMKNLEEDIDKLTLEIDELGRNIEAVEKFKERFPVYGDELLDENGYPLDERVKNAIQKWEKENNMKWDADPEKINNILNQVLGRYINNQDLLHIDRRHKQEKWDQYHDQWKSAEGSIQILEKYGYWSHTSDQKQLETWIAKQEELIAVTIDHDNNIGLEQNEEVPIPTPNPIKPV